MTFRSRPLLDLARGQECMACIPNVCCNNPETTVSAHRNGGGMGTKHSDWQVAWCCVTCHDFIDGRSHKDVDQDTRDRYWEAAHEATTEAMWQYGLIQVTGNVPRVTARRIKKSDPAPYQRSAKILEHRGYSR